MSQDATSAGQPVGIAGIGAYVPERILTNAELSAMVDTSDEWITTRTGIRERHIARPDQAASDLGAIAATRALESAGVKAEDVDLIVVPTITPDMVFPSTACFIQKAIGAKKAACFDLEAACSGFIFALETGRRFIESGAMNTVLVVCTEKLSSIVDWQDRGTCVLFGDGAGAVVLRRNTAGGRGILSAILGSDGNLAHLLSLPGGGSRNPTSEETLRNRMHFLKMEGREVFKHAVNTMTAAARKAIEQSGLSLADIAWIIPHQANMRIVQAIADKLDLPIEKFYVNLERYGNMSAASIPVALDEAVRLGKIKKKDVVLMVAFGGGFTWAALVLEL
ncbi:MAG: ketoacyl-ACP synthase III [Lentisphaerae bacterium]|nr:ketoacyl-ACP synthase III [Lentisphaerota bacterium]